MSRILFRSRRLREAGEKRFYSELTGYWVCFWRVKLGFPYYPNNGRRTVKTVGGEHPNAIVFITDHSYLISAPTNGTEKHQTAILAPS